MPLIGSKSTSILPQPVPQDDVQLPISSSSVEVLPTPETSQEALMDSTGSDIMDDPAMRASKRKRKPPTPLEDSPTPGSVSGWARAAVGSVSQFFVYLFAKVPERIRYCLFVFKIISFFISTALIYIFYLIQ